MAPPGYGLALPPPDVGRYVTIGFLGLSASTILSIASVATVPGFTHGNFAYNFYSEKSKAVFGKVNCILPIISKTADGIGGLGRSRWSDLQDRLLDDATHSH